VVETFKRPATTFQWQQRVDVSQVKGDHMLKRREALPAGSGPAIAKCDERFGLKTQR